jgi:hypothetical protein
MRKLLKRVLGTPKGGGKKFVLMINHGGLFSSDSFFYSFLKNVELLVIKVIFDFNPFFDLNQCYSLQLLFQPKIN